MTESTYFNLKGLATALRYFIKEGLSVKQKKKFLKKFRFGHDLPPPLWTFFKQKEFFSLIKPVIYHKLVSKLRSMIDLRNQYLEKKFNVHLLAMAVYDFFLV